MDGWPRDGTVFFVGYVQKGQNIVSLAFWLCYMLGSRGEIEGEELIISRSAVSRIGIYFLSNRAVKVFFFLSTRSKLYLPLEFHS